MDTIIQFHLSQWDNIPVSVQVFIGQICGPLTPNEKGVVTMVMSESRWEQIQKMIAKESK